MLGDEERKLIDAIADKKNYVSEQLFTSGLSLNLTLLRERPLRGILTFTDTTTSRSRERVGGALEKHIR